jgi:hypothetical protein
MDAQCSESASFALQWFAFQDNLRGFLNGPPLSNDDEEADL